MSGYKLKDPFGELASEYQKSPRFLDDNKEKAWNDAILDLNKNFLVWGEFDPGGSHIHSPAFLRET